jgi:hypothetical protein
MSSFELPSNFAKNPEKLLRSSRCRLVIPQKFILDLDPFKEGGSTPPPKEAMAQKTISDFLAPLIANIAMRPQVNLGDAHFELKPALINMVQTYLFCGKPPLHGSVWHLHHHGRYLKRHPSLPLPILIAREGEAVVLW